MNTQCISEGEPLHTSVTDGSILTEECVVTCMDAEGFSDGWAGGTLVAGGTEAWDKGVVTCLDALTVTKLKALLYTTREGHSEDPQKCKLAWRHGAVSDLRLASFSATFLSISALVLSLRDLSSASFLASSCRRLDLL